MIEKDNRTVTEKLLAGGVVDLGRLPGAADNGIYRCPVRLNRDGRVELTSGFGARSEELRVLEAQVKRDIITALAGQKRR